MAKPHFAVKKNRLAGFCDRLVNGAAGLVWSILSRKRRKKLADDASRSRANKIAVKIAWGAVIFYNCVGLLDIASTHIAVTNGAGEEANPVMRIAMANLGPGWVGAKLMLQMLISVMVLWFPHRIVLAIFILAVSFNAWIVYQNFAIAGFF